MDHETGRFVDNREMLVLEEDSERNRIGAEGARRLVLGETDGNSFTADESPRGPGRLVVHGDGPLGDQTCGLGAG
jgi:hypothetical protein